MEARRFGFDASLPPAFKFHPTDADIVAHYLLPRAVNYPNPHAHAVIDDDACSCPPWELMRRHGHADSDHAFFFGPACPPGKEAGFTNRTIPNGEYGVGGKWRGQKGEEQDLFLVRGGAGGAEIHLKFKRYNLTYYRHGQEGSTGWVMHEYHITKPPSLLPGAVLSRVKITDAAKKERQEQRNNAAAAAAQQVVPCQEQQGPPSNYLVDGHAAGNTVALSYGAGTSGGAQSDVAHQGGDNGVVMGGYYTDLLNNAEEGDGYYVDSNNDHLNEDINNYLDLGQGDGDGSDYFTFADYSNFDHPDGGNGD
ncbi:NAC transcription factor NAM-2-like [Phragmites australis]|uniref:NAC transcription factor NAM-2-like n=1 Tax=Phragmites australis TaxID=29695 RepID=UPI002D7930C9|nr:NAC transcription factor NAM-2-like [Phragmites australis]